MRRSFRSRTRPIIVRVELLEDRRLLSHGGGYDGVYPAPVEPDDGGLGAQGPTAFPSGNDVQGVGGRDDGESASNLGGSNQQNSAVGQSEQSDANQSPRAANTNDGPMQYDPAPTPTAAPSGYDAAGGNRGDHGESASNFGGSNQDSSTVGQSEQSHANQSPRAANDGPMQYDPAPVPSRTGGTATPAGYETRDSGYVAPRAPAANRAPDATTPGSYSGTAQPEYSEPVGGTRVAGPSRGADVADGEDASGQAEAETDSPPPGARAAVAAGSDGPSSLSDTPAPELAPGNRSATVSPSATPSTDATKATASHRDAAPETVAGQQPVDRHFDSRPQGTSISSQPHDGSALRQYPVRGADSGGQSERTTDSQILTRRDAAGGTAPAVDTILAAAPQLAGLLSDVLPLDLASMERGIDRLLEQVERVRRELSESFAALNVPVCLLLVAGGAAACEVIRLQRKSGDPAHSVAGLQDCESSSWLPDSAGARPEELT